MTRAHSPKDRRARNASGARMTPDTLLEVALCDGAGGMAVAGPLAPSLQFCVFFVRTILAMVSGKRSHLKSFPQFPLAVTAFRVHPQNESKPWCPCGNVWEAQFRHLAQTSSGSRWTPRVTTGPFACAFCTRKRLERHEGGTDEWDGIRLRLQWYDEGAKKHGPEF